MLYFDINVWITTVRQKKIKGLEVLLGLNETVKQLAISNSVRLYVQVLKR